MTTLNPAGYPIIIQGNGLVLEWKRGYADKSECWWLRDEKPTAKSNSATYRQRARIKATPQVQWSRTFKSWYYRGGAVPPSRWLSLVGYAASTPPADDTGLELLPDWLIQQIQTGKLTEHQADQVVYAKLFMADADFYFFVRDYDPHERWVFGYAILNSDLDMAEWGWQSLAELEQVRGQLGLPMERDIFFTPQPFHVALQTWRREHGFESAPDPAEPARQRLKAQFEALLAALDSEPKLLPPVATIRVDDPWS